MLLRYHLISGVRIELTRHEILVSVQVIVKVNDLFNGYGVRAPPHCFLGKTASVVLVTTRLHVQIYVCAIFVPTANFFERLRFLNLYFLKNRHTMGFWGFGEIGRASCRERV